jgi:hypothetical protein
MKLQVNTSGAWKDLGEFDKTREKWVVDAIRQLDNALDGNRPKWCLVDDKGNREWLKFP